MFLFFSHVEVQHGRESSIRNRVFHKIVGGGNSHFPIFKMEGKRKRTTSYVIDRNQRMRTMEGPVNVGLVAELMDEWTRAENTAYATCMENKETIIQQQAKVIRNLRMQQQRLTARNSVYIARLRAMSTIILDQNEFIDMDDGILSNLPYPMADIQWDEDNVPYVVSGLRPYEVIDLTSDETLGNDILED